MNTKDIKTNFSEQADEKLIKNFLEADNMQIKTIKTNPIFNKKGDFEAQIIAYVKDGWFKKPTKFIARYNNEEFNLIRLKKKGNEEISLHREWQVFLFKNFGKDYLDYHEYRTTKEIGEFRKQIGVIESSTKPTEEQQKKKKFLINQILRLEYEKTL